MTQQIPVGAGSGTMRSPILSLEDGINASALTIAPEREVELLALRDSGIEFELVDELLFGIRASPETRRIILPIASLEYLWCRALRCWIVFDEMRLAQRAGENILDLTSNDRLRKSGSLVKWSEDNLRESGLRSWPLGLPRPEANPQQNSDIHVANELFLGALAFIVLHEAGHLKLGHTLYAAAYSQNQEREADKFSTNWILEKAGSEEQRRKRGLCIAVALLCLQSLETHVIFRIGRDHPPVHERIENCLTSFSTKNEEVESFIVACLQEIFAGNGVIADVEGRTFSDIRDSLFFDIARRSAE